MANENNNLNVIASEERAKQSAASQPSLRGDVARNEAKAISSKQRKSLIPKLRFKEFEGKWEQKKLETLVNSISSGKIKPDNDGEYLVYGSTGVIGKSNQFTHEGEYILIARVGANAGKINRVSGKYSVTDNTLIIDSKSEVLDNCFTEGFLEKFNLNRLIFGSGQPLITGGLLKNIKINLPNLPEQQKIANFLTAVDTKLQQLSTKKETLEQYKKGVMQQLFSYKKRLVVNGELRKGKLIDFGHFYYGKGAPKTSIVPNAPTPCVRYGELYSTYNEEIKEIKSYTNVNPKDLKLSEGGEVLVPRVGEDPLEFANCSFLPFPNVAIGEMISVYNTNEDGLFMTYYINAKLKKELARKVEGGNVSNLYFRYVQEIEVEIPSKFEQEKIVNFLKVLDLKIEAVQTQISNTQAFKKGLLQQMFV